MDNLKKVTNVLLNDVDSEFALTPYNPKPSKKLKDLFAHFNLIDTPTLYNSVIDNVDNIEFEHIERSLNTIKHYKGLLNEFNDSLDFTIYKKIKPWLDNDAKHKFKIHFYRHYAKQLLNDEIETLEDFVTNLILVNDVNLYMEVAKKLKISDAIIQIYSRYPKLVFKWLNGCQDVYGELIKLNQPGFILQNMNGELDITDGTLKYILEKADVPPELFASIKSTVGLKKLYTLTNGNINPIYYKDLVDTIEDFIFVINIDNMKLYILEDILNTMKVRFPNVYENLNSVLIAKNNLNNK
jgi:hypothetical protein